MAGKIICKDLETLPAASVRQLPCTVHFNGRADVSKKFGTYLEPNEDGTVNGYFRGHPLIGTQIEVPKDYKGFVCSSQTEGSGEKVLKTKATFEKWTYFNWSVPPSKADPQQSIQDWISVANALHRD